MSEGYKEYPANSRDLIIFDREGMIFGHKLCGEIKTNGPKDVCVVQGIDINCYVAYLKKFYPNYAAVRALDLSGDEIQWDQLEAISYNVPLTVGDAIAMKHYQDRAEANEN
jgi:hypothetical protein